MGKILFSVATVENAYDRVRLIRLIPADHILDEEPRLLESMPILPVPETNVLIVNEIGKNVSGGGMDPHIVGRFVNRAMRGGIASRRLIVLYITEEFKGGGIGLVRADFSTQRAF